MYIYVVTTRSDFLTSFINSFQSINDHIQVVCFDSDEEALSVIAKQPPALFIVDAVYSERMLVQRIVKIIEQNAFIHVAVISSQPAEQLHDLTEGLGLVAMLPSEPQYAHATELVDVLKAVGYIGEKNNSS